MDADAKTIAAVKVVRQFAHDGSPDIGYAMTAIRHLDDGGFFAEFDEATGYEHTSPTPAPELEQHEIESGVPGLRNWSVPVPGSTVTVSLGQQSARPGEWCYSLWADTENGEPGTTMIASGTLRDIPTKVTAEQVARITFLLHVDYA